MKTTLRARRLYRVNRELGLCVVCAQHAAPYARCLKHRVAQAAKSKRWRDRRVM